MASIVIGAFSFLCSLPGATVDIAQGPLYLGRNVPGNLALVPSVEYPTIISQANIGPYDVGRAYMGYFDNAKCYEYVFNDKEAERHFNPSSMAANRICAGAQEWSGNYLTGQRPRPSILFDWRLPVVTGCGIPRLRLGSRRHVPMATLCLRIDRKS